MAARKVQTLLPLAVSHAPSPGAASGASAVLLTAKVWPAARVMLTGPPSIQPAPRPIISSKYSRLMNTIPLHSFLIAAVRTPRPPASHSLIASPAFVRFQRRRRHWGLGV